MPSIAVRRILLSLTLALPLAVWTPSALADPEPSSRWYGWQTLSTDGAAVTLTVMGAASSVPSMSGPLVTFGAGSYLFGGPIVHAAHGNWGRAAGSLGLRIGAPFAGGVIGVSMANCQGSHEFMCGVGETALGMLIGMTTAMVIDASVLARDTEPSTPSVVPLVQMSRDQTWAGVMSRF